MPKAAESPKQKLAKALAKLKKRFPGFSPKMLVQLKTQHPRMNVYDLIKFIIKRLSAKRKRAPKKTSEEKKAASAAPAKTTSAPAAAAVSEVTVRKLVNDYSELDRNRGVAKPAETAAAKPAAPPLPALPAPKPVPALPAPAAKPGVYLRLPDGREEDVSKDAKAVITENAKHKDEEKKRLSAAEEKRLEGLRIDFRAGLFNAVKDAYTGLKGRPTKESLQNLAKKAGIDTKLRAEDGVVAKTRDKTNDELMRDMVAAEKPDAIKAIIDAQRALQLADPKYADVKKEFMKGSGRKLGDPLSTVEIDRMMSRVPGFQRTIASDEPIKAVGSSVTPTSPPSWVMNLDKSTGPGTHWVAMMITPHSVEYFDSYGEEPDPDVQERLVAEGMRLWPDNKKTVKINRVKQQADNTNRCGFYACKFIADRLNGKSFKEVTGYDGNVRKYEREVADFEKRYPRFVQIGKGLLDHPGEKMPYQVKKTLDKYGDDAIVSITVGRTPVQKPVTALINALSFGKFNEALKKYDYEDLFHLFSIIKTSSGASLRIEKNATVSFKPGTMPSEAKTMDVPTPAKGTLVKDLFKDQNSPGFWTYRAVTENCQDFQLRILRSVGVLTDSARKFIKQDVEELVKGLGPIAIPAANKITDLGGRVDGAVDKAVELKDKVVDKAEEIKDKVVDKATEIKDKAVEGAKGLFDSIKNKASSILGSGHTVGVARGYERFTY